MEGRVDEIDIQPTLGLDADEPLTAPLGDDEAPPALPQTPTAAAPPGRSVDARLARLHLRGGLLALARAELEQMAGAAMLDREALADLAEARWRSGDLEGAAEAAEAHLATGGEEPLAHLIVAEEAERQGRILDARRHAAEVQRLVGPGLERLFAGEPRSTAWPAALPPWTDAHASEPGRWGLLVGGSEVSSPAAGTWDTAQASGRLAGITVEAGSPGSGQVPAATFRRVADPPVSAGTAPGSMDALMDAGRAAGRELVTIEQELAAGNVASVAGRLAILLRLDPALAPMIISLAERAAAAATHDAASYAALQLVRGDAYRTVGRELEATDAYQEAMRALPPRSTPEETS
jgi:hypothetical protein